MSGGRRWAIVGGGMLGLTLAHRLARHGDAVTVYEAAPTLGGLASAWQLGDIVWDRHYHVTLLSDANLRALLAELGLEQEMRWVETRTGCYSGGRLYPLSNGLDFLRFPALALLDKMRLAVTIVYGSMVRNWQRLERVRVEPWLTRWSGRRTFQRFWLPLLRAKLGDSYRDASAAFIWATIQRLSAARRAGLQKEMFGYVPGGYARILERFAEVLRGEGVDIRVATPIAAIDEDRGAVRVRQQDGAIHVFDQVVLTTSPSAAARLLPMLSATERERLTSIRYQGIVCASLLLDRPLSPYYLTYITDDAPFTAVVEMSALVDRQQLNGHSLVYLPAYCGPGDAVAAMSDDEVRETFLTALERMYPGFSRAHVASFRVSRVREVFAIPTVAYSSSVPPFATSARGVHLVTSAQIVNGTLNVNETLGLAERAVRTLCSVPRTSPPVVSAELARTSPAPGGRPAATLSIDLDNLWSYLMIRGDQSWRAFPSFLDIVVPRVVRLLDVQHQPVTWFVVGRDAAAAAHRDLLGSVAAAGHEIGNHSHWHEPWLHRYSPERVEEELSLAELAIEGATGRRPIGFRGPGFSLSKDLLLALERRGYQYDASTFPTFIGPLARAFYFGGLDLTRDEREERAVAFGAFGEGFRPLTPYTWRLAGRGLVEVPVTTMPVLRTPIHMSYLVYLAERSPSLAHAYWAAALRLCRVAGIAPSFLLHSHDFIGGDEVPAMSFFPGFRMTSDAKLRLVGQCIERLQREFDVMPLSTFVARQSALRSIEPRFSAGSERTQAAAPAVASRGDDR